MPIATIEERSREGGEWPRIAILRKGAKKDPANPNRPGQDLDKYLRFAADDDPDTERQFAEVFGASDLKVTQVRVALPYADWQDNLVQWQEEHVAGHMVHRCDGVTCVLWWNEATGGYSTEPKPCPGGCKWVTKLFVWLVDLKRTGVVLVLSGSKYDAIELNNNIKAIYALRGDCRGIPLILSRSKRRISMPEKTGSTKRVRRPKWLLHLEIAGDWSAARLEWERLQALPLPDAKQLEQIKRLQIADRALSLGDLKPQPDVSPTHVDAKPLFDSVEDDDDMDGDEDYDDGVMPGEYVEEAAAPQPAVEVLPQPAATKPAAVSADRPTQRRNWQPTDMAKVAGNVRDAWIELCHKLAREYPAQFAVAGTTEPDWAELLARAKEHGYALISGEALPQIGKQLRNWAKSQ